jgi:translation elongation factor P/translation initiation factor 5A
MASAGDVERGKYIEYKREILQVIRKEVMSCGKHSHSKLHFTVCKLDGSSEKEIVLSHNDPVEIIDIMKRQATLISKGELVSQIMDRDSYETFDARCERDLLNDLIEGEEVIYINYNGDVRIIDKKSQKK